MIVGIVGSRCHDELGARCAKIVRYAVGLLGPDDIVISGGCKTGADYWAKDESFKQCRRYIEAPVKKMSTWDDFATEAHKRNMTIAMVCDKLLAVWDGKSGGTRKTIQYAQALGKPIWVVQL